MRFKARVNADRRLAEALENYRGKDVVVYSLPRGSMVLGYEIARALSAPLDLIYHQKDRGISPATPSVPFVPSLRRAGGSAKDRESPSSTMTGLNPRPRRR
jgi:hypothetical protein